MSLKLSLNVQNLKIIRTHLIGTLSERETIDQGSHIRLTFIFAFARVFFFFVLFCVFLFFVLRAVLGFSLSFICKSGSPIRFQFRAIFVLLT